MANKNNQYSSRRAQIEVKKLQIEISAMSVGLQALSEALDDPFTDEWSGEAERFWSFRPGSHVTAEGRYGVGRIVGPDPWHSNQWIVDYTMGGAITTYHSVHRDHLIKLVDTPVA